MPETKRVDVEAGENTQPGYEKRDISLQAVLLFGGGLALTIIAILLLLGGLFDLFAGRPREVDALPSRLYEAGQLPPEPRLQAAPVEDMQALRAREEAILNSYEWLDREAGIIRIPIERAIDLVVERGLPAPPAPQRGEIEAEGK